jgi:hypothetical protein
MLRRVDLKFQELTDQAPAAFLGGPLMLNRRTFLGGLSASMPLFATCGPFRAQGTAPRLHAMVVGINLYTGRDGHGRPIRALRGCQNDAADIERQVRRFQPPTLVPAGWCWRKGAAMNETFEPTRLGREFLRRVAQAKWLLRAPYHGDAQEDAIAERMERHHAELRQVHSEIVAKPVQSVGDLLDRLILLAHEADPSWDVEHSHVLPILGGALAVAGILVGDCMVGEGHAANALAAGA